MELIDTHCHLTALEKDLAAVFDSAFKCHVKKMLCIGAGDGIASATQAVELAMRFEHVWASVGIHPHDAKDYVDPEVLRPLLANPRVVAIGETGLDFFRDWAPIELQVELFRRTIRLAKEVKKPLIIHCREAEVEVLRMLTDEGASEVGGVFHCYAGDEILASKLKKINFLVSFPGTLTFKKAEALRAVASAIPLEQIMLETDAPYMAPEPFRGGPSEPMHVYQIALKLAEIKNVALDEIARITSANACRLFGIPLENGSI